MKNINIAVDAMGSDNKIEVEVKAAMRIVQLIEDINITLFGDKEQIANYLTTHDRISVVHCSEEVDVNEEPVAQIRKKKDSSLVRALKAVKDGECDTIVSAGSTGAVIAGGLFIIGRIKGIKRPALAPIIPSLDGEVKILLDVGATDECKELYLLQNAKMGSEYAKVLGVKFPKVALLNIGAEAKKGTKIYQNAYNQLSEDAAINFIGNIEGRDILTTQANVIVVDGFSGNIALKTLEGTALSVAKMFKDVLTSSVKNKVAAGLIKKDLKVAMKAFDHHEVGGSLLIGCNQVIVKAHGSSTDYSFSKAIELAYNLEKDKIVKNIVEAI